MMTQFLKQVASHYLAQDGLEDKVFVFPNRRATVFFKKYMRDSFRESETGPRVMPTAITVEKFFSTVTGLSKGDKITLLLALHGCYSAIHKRPRSLDDFIGWGDVLLSDFDEVDKYLVDASRLFVNVADFQRMQDDLSWAEEEQKRAVGRLVNHFSEGEWKLRSPGGDGVKDRFLETWEILLPLYESFRETLLARGFVYEGMIYRDFAERLSSESAVDLLATAYPSARKFVFVGFNALNTCERAVFDSMQKAGLAEFCWDFCGPMLTDPANDSSFFMREYMTRYPNAFEIEGGGVPDVRVIGVPSAAGQAELLGRVIADLRARDGGDCPDWLDYAVVLPDETMLGCVLNNIPDEVDSVNVTMGYPLASSEFFMFLRSLMSLQMHMRRSGDTWYFYHRQVHDIMSCGTLKCAFGPDERRVASEIASSAKPFVPVSDFGGSELLAFIFKPVVTEMAVADAAAVDKFAGYLLEVMSEVVSRIGDADVIQTECARKCYTCINRLREYHMAVLPQTFFRLAVQLASGLTVPYEGEPLGGLQVMGPLETRALDFRHIVILNASEGVFPHRSASGSFIPPELRHGFELPTYKHQDAMWAYYFYRMISRAETVTMLYDSRTEGLASGEESRYVKQLRYLYKDRCKLSECVAAASISASPIEETIEKTPEDVAKIMGKDLSASAVQQYMACPVRFYYNFVKELYVDDEVKDNLDAGMLGTVCHKVLEDIYGQRAGGLITEEFLSGWLNSDGEAKLKETIYALIREKLHSFEVTGQNLIDARLALQFVRKVMEADVELIRKRGPIRILGVELHYNGQEVVPGFKFKGVVDRLDTFDDGTVRIVDYKTGGDLPDVLDASNPEKLVNDVLVRKDHTKKAALQFYLYDRFVAGDEKYSSMLRTNAMYAMNDLFRHPVEPRRESPEFVRLMDEGLVVLLEEIVDCGKPFRRASDTKTCKYCDYRMLCGKSVSD